MRIALFGLLLANLMLFAWSQWLAPQPVGTPVVAQAAGGSAPAGATARILLASERPPSTPPPPEPAAGAGNVATPAAEGPVPTAAEVPAASPDGVTAGPSAAAATNAGVAAAVAVPVPVAVTAAAGAATPSRCVSMGPFADLELTAQATAMLKQDGYQPRQRPAKGPVPDGFMVMIGPLKGEADQARVIGRLNRGGLDDAFALPKLDEGYAVSVGLFNQRARAERRVVAVERMGLKSSVVDRTRPGTVYWLDFDLKAAAGDAGALDPLLKAADPAQKWQVVACPQSRPVG